jgi:hypothetical protein
LLDLRYGDRLKVLQDIKEDEQDRIVPGAIQHVLQLMLAEDHISDDMLTLSINRSNDYLVISSLNSNADINLEEIRNIQQRYEFFTDLKVKTESNEKGVLCTIPILKEEI